MTSACYDFKAMAVFEPQAIDLGPICLPSSFTIYIWGTLDIMVSSHMVFDTFLHIDGTILVGRKGSLPTALADAGSPFIVLYVKVICFY